MRKDELVRGDMDRAESVALLAKRGGVKSEPRTTQCSRRSGCEPTISEIHRHCCVQRILRTNLMREKIQVYEGGTLEAVM